MKPIIVIGMHRSGTSLMVKILEELGVFMGADQEHNGESEFFLKMNKWLFHQAHISWDNPGNYNSFPDEAKETLIPIIKNRLVSFHKKKYFGNEEQNTIFSNINFPWGWKDPRNTFIIDIWKQIFGNLRIIHIHRNPLDVIASLYEREKVFKTNIGNPTGTGLKKKWFGLKLPKQKLFLQQFRCLDFNASFSLWKEYVIQAFNVSNNPSEIVHISYEELLSSPDLVISKLAKFLKLENKVKATEKFINPNRSLAFKDNPDLVEFYNKIKDDELVKKLNYGELIENS